MIAARKADARFQIAFIVPFAASLFPKIREFLLTAREEFSEEVLIDIQIYSWIGSNTLGIIFTFNTRSSESDRLGWFSRWIREIRFDVIELESFSPEKKHTLLKKFDLTSDMKFKGGFDLHRALHQIGNRFMVPRGIRRESRVPARVKVQFKTHEAFAEETAENISTGGMFIRGRTDLPLGTRLEMAIELPGGDKILAIGEVAHIVTEEKAALIDRDTVPGCGLKFVEFLRDGKIQLKNFLENPAGP